MHFFRIVTPALCVLLFFAWGCSSTQGGKDAMKGTKAFYYRNVNKPAKLEFDHSMPLEPYQAELAKAIAPIDYELEELLRAMDDSDRSPDEEWARTLKNRFSWLGGVFMTDGKGRLMNRVPASSSPLPDLAPLLTLDPKQRQTDLRAAIMPGTDGPELYLAKPVYLQSDLRVLIVCHFDLRALLARHGEPEKFMLLSGLNLLWPGVYNISETPLHGVDFAHLAKDSVDGTLQNDNGEFYWMSSYFANIELVYALPVKGSFSVNTRQTAILKTARFAGPGRGDTPRPAARR